MSDLERAGKLKIATWNCKGAYRKKQKHLIEKFDPDVWIIQECEHPDKFSKEKEFEYPENYVWYGDNLNRGVAVFSKSGYNLRISDEHTDEFRYIIPVVVSGKIDLNVYAIWAMKADKEKRKQRYIGQIFCAFNHYLLNGLNTIIIGDYNWNLNFDKNSYSLHGKFRDFLEQMEQANFQSAYHKCYSEEFGKESQPTLHLQGKKDKPYHIDYIFGNKDLIQKFKNIQLGKWEDWQNWSDHVPIYAEIEI